MQAFNPPDPEFESRVRSSFNLQQLMKTISAQLVKVSPGEVHIEIPFQQALTQQNGFIHAGIITSIVDSACGFAAYSLMAAASGVLTVEYKINLLSPAIGERFLAIGRVRKPGRTLTVCEGDVFAHTQGDEKLVATMLATMMRLSRKTVRVSISRFENPGSQSGAMRRTERLRQGGPAPLIWCFGLGQKGNPMRSISPTLPRRRLISFTLFILMTCFVGLAVTAQTSIAGHWEGAIALPNGALSFSVDFATSADGKLSATITIPQQGAKDLSLTNVSLSGADVAFDLPNVPGEPKFRGKLSADGKKIEGTFSQAGANLPCSLERKADPMGLAKDSLAGFDEVAADAIKKFEVPGMAICVVKGKDVIYAKGFGYRDVEKQLPVTADTLFAIGSSSKAFATFVLGTLVDEGKVEWDKPVRNYIPWFKLYDPSMTEHLSVRDLVTHRSGLPRHDLIWYNNFEISREAIVRRLAYLEPSADLREKFQYNNLMFLTAGYLTEVLTGKTWEDAVRARVLDPLGMKRTNFSVVDSQKDNDFAQPYDKKDGKIEKIPFRPITNLAPAGSINSSVNEMARWVTVHLNGGKFGDKKVAEAPTVADMHLAHMVTGATSPETEITGGEYGMGWFGDSYRGHRRVEHGGNIDGFSANVVLFPKDDVGIVVLTNLNGTPLRDLIAQVAADRLLGLKPIDWITQGVSRRNLGEAAAKEGEKKKAVTRIAGTQPSHKLADYAGGYEHPGYGILKIALNGDKLEATFNRITTPLEHWHYDTFNGGKVKDAVFENMKFTFQTDVNGFIAGVSAPFEAAVKEIVFVRKPDPRLFDPAYLARFTGDYNLLGQTISVGVKGSTLVANIPGQPQFDLVPGLSGDFAIKQAQVVTLHFVTDEQGQVSGVELRQPGTVLTAKRKQ